MPEDLSRPRVHYGIMGEHGFVTAGELHGSVELSCYDPYEDSCLIRETSGTLYLPNVEFTATVQPSDFHRMPSRVTSLAIDCGRPFVPRYATVREYKLQRKGHRTKAREIASSVRRLVYYNVAIEPGDGRVLRAL